MQLDHAAVGDWTVAADVLTVQPALGPHEIGAF